MSKYWFGKVIAKTRGQIEWVIQKFWPLTGQYSHWSKRTRFWPSLAVFYFVLCLMFLSINVYKLVGEITLLTSYQKSLVKLVDCFKSYELWGGSTVIEVKVTKTVRLWKFCRDLSLDLGFSWFRWEKTSTKMMVFKIGHNSFQNCAIKFSFDF
jgi:hypothetical protein